MKRHKKSIGGFFELEAGCSAPKQDACHAGALALSSGRACFHFILDKVAPKRVHVPFFCCDALLQPLVDKGISYQFYAIDAALEIDDALTLKDGEYIVYVNYFGIKTGYANKLVARYGDRLILDQTQAFFEKAPGQGWSFNSARKFFGVPDGGFLYGPDLTHADLARNPHYSTEHLVAKKWGNGAEAYAGFTAYEKGIRTDVYRISAVSEGLLSTVDMDEAQKKRKKNFNYFQKAFKKDNLLKFDRVDEDAPSAYPLLLNKDINKASLYQLRIFIPTFWSDVLARGADTFDYEQYLSAHLLPLPVDHRYGKRHCRIIIDAIRKLM